MTGRPLVIGKTHEVARAAAVALGIEGKEGRDWVSVSWLNLGAGEGQHVSRVVLANDDDGRPSPRWADALDLAERTAVRYGLEVEHYLRGRS